MITYLKEKGLNYVLIQGKLTRARLTAMWDMIKDGELIAIVIQEEDYKVIHQIENKKFTVDGVMYIRKEGELKLTDGIVYPEGFELFKEIEEHTVTRQEAKKIIESWK